MPAATTPSEPRPILEPGTKATTTTTTINARDERIKGATAAVLKLHDLSENAPTAQERAKAKKNQIAIAQFGQRLKDKKALTDPLHIDQLMDEMLDDDQKQFVAGLF